MSSTDSKLVSPLTYNIAHGIIVGVISYTLLNGSIWAIRKVSGGRISPADYDEGERWEVPPGGVVPFWMCVSHPAALPRFFVNIIQETRCAWRHEVLDGPRAGSDRACAP